MEQIHDELISLSLSLSPFPFPFHFHFFLSPSSICYEISGAMPKVVWSDQLSLCDICSFDYHASRFHVSIGLWLYTETNKWNVWRTIIRSSTWLRHSFNNSIFMGRSIFNSYLTLSCSARSNIIIAIILLSSTLISRNRKEIARLERLRALTTLRILRYSMTTSFRRTYWPESPD